MGRGQYGEDKMEPLESFLLEATGASGVAILVCSEGRSWWWWAEE